MGVRSYFAMEPKLNRMKAHATLKNVDSEPCKLIIVRNLKRILDIRIIDIDVENGILHFLYSGHKAYENVKKELSRIGYPILQCIYEPTQNSGPRTVLWIIPLF